MVGKGLVGKLALGVTGVAMAAAVATVAVGPRVSDWYEGRHREQVSYALGSEAKADRRAVPDWLPDGATSVHYARSTTRGDRLLTADLPDGRLPAGCKAIDRSTPGGAGKGGGGTAGRAADSAGHATDAGDRVRPVRFKTTWFPADAPAKISGTCGSYQVALVGNHLYAWQDDAAVRTALTAEHGTAR